MSEQLTDAERLAGARVLYQLAPEICRACDGDGLQRALADGRLLPEQCAQCHGSGHVRMLDRLGTTVGLARHPSEPDDAFRLRIIDHFCKGRT